MRSPRLILQLGLTGSQEPSIGLPAAMRNNGIARKKNPTSCFSPRRTVPFEREQKPPLRFAGYLSLIEAGLATGESREIHQLELAQSKQMEVLQGLRSARDAFARDLELGFFVTRHL